MEAGELAVVVGLQSQTQYNYGAVVVVALPAEGEDRVAVKTIHGESGGKSLSVRRRHLLRAADRGDRDLLFARIAWERQLELRCARAWLESRVPEALCLRVASFFAPRETMALTSGFARGRVVPQWTVCTGCAWEAIHHGDREGARIVGADGISDGIERIDCAVVDVGGGLFLVAGGCDDHPSRARAFFRSAFIFDAVTRSVRQIPDMPCQRHGCGGARVGAKVYVVGGDYCGHGPGRALGAVFDLDAETWTSLPGTIHPEELSDVGGLREELSTVAFVPVGAVRGRVVVLSQGSLKVFNPRDPRGWRTVAGRGEAVESLIGTSASGSCVWRDRLVVATGRGSGVDACAVAAFQFDADADATGDWTRGKWSHLGFASSTGRVGCDLSVVHDRLYVSGGVDEATSRFDASVVRWAGSSTDLALSFARPCGARILEPAAPFQQDDALEMPEAMHAHASITVPLLPPPRPPPLG